jgi:hypothetical protein
MHQSAYASAQQGGAGRSYNAGEAARGAIAQGCGASQPQHSFSALWRTGYVSHCDGGGPLVKRAAVGSLVWVS